MMRTRVTVTVGALLIAGTALTAPSSASALALRSHAPAMAAHVPAVAYVPAVAHVPAPAVAPAVAPAPAAAHAPVVVRLTDEQQVRQAILHSKLLGVVKPSNVTVSDIRFVGTSHAWAGALATPKNGQTDPAQVLLHRTGFTWQVRDLGTAGVGCGIAPASVRSSLGLHGVC